MRLRLGRFAGTSAVRGEYNLVHGSDSPETAAKEISLYFKPEEIAKYNFADARWLYGKND